MTDKVTIPTNIDETDFPQLSLANIHKHTYGNGKSSQEATLVYQNGEDPFVFFFKDVRSNGGIIVSKFGKLFTGVSLNPEQSMQGRKLDDRIKQLVFENKERLLKDLPAAVLKKLTIDGMDLIYDPIVQDGRPNPEKLGENFNDSFTCAVPSVQTASKPLQPNTNLCEITSHDGKPHSWQQLKGVLNHIAVEVTKIYIKEGKVKVGLEARNIQSQSQARKQVYMVRHKLEESEDEPAAKRPATKPKSAPVTHKKVTSAFEGKLNDEEPESAESDKSENP